MSVLDIMRITSFQITIEVEGEEIFTGSKEDIYLIFDLGKGKLCWLCLCILGRRKDAIERLISQFIKITFIILYEKSIMEIILFVIVVYRIVTTCQTGKIIYSHLFSAFFLFVNSH